MKEFVFMLVRAIGLVGLSAAMAWYLGKALQ